MGSVCSGGRYDNLAEYYTDRKLPGVGISIGLTRLFSKLIEEKVITIDDSCSSDIIILPMCDNYDYIYKVNNKLIEQGLKVDICFIEKGFKQKIKYADKLNCKYVIIIGGDEVDKKIVTFKNMIDGSQLEIDFKDLDSIRGQLK